MLNARIAVVGSGAMGAGIALVAASNGHDVILIDANDAAVERARSFHVATLDRDIAKGRTDAASAARTLDRFTYIASTNVDALRDCDVVIEAVVEDITIKKELFRKLEVVVKPDAILATNTSSLSISALAGSCVNSHRVIGIHFFNPANIMPLVEIIPSLTTSSTIVNRARELVDSWRKTAVIASDTPGFIVNRIARPFYGESLRVLEEGVASIATIDWSLREVGGFKMGPFELMDLIGNDVNYAVTCSVFESMFFDSRYKPSHTQRSLVNAGRYGRKTGHGYYNYDKGAAMPEPVRDEVLASLIVKRVVAMLINEAVDALFMGVATASDIEIAMTKGVNYPRGLLEWGDDIGAESVLRTIDDLYDTYREDRYRASPLLRRAALSGELLLS